MSDAQSLLIVVVLIYLSDCVVWLRPDAVAVVIPLFGRAAVRTGSWAGNERGAFAFTTLLPARAVFVLDGGGSFDLERIDERRTSVLAQTRGLRAVTCVLFTASFVVAPAVGWWLGFAQVGLLLIAAFLLGNLVTALVFFRTHQRVEPADRFHRWVHALVMVVATPSAIRAVDHVTRNVMHGLDPLAVAARIAGEDDPRVKKMLRELAHPLGGGAPGERYDAARVAGLRHEEQRPARAAAYCPRCLAEYDAGTATCADCELALL